MPITLSNPGERTEQMDVEQSTDLVTRWKAEIEAAAEGETVEIVNLTGRVYPPGGAKVVADFLKDYTSTIKKVDMSDVIASLQTELGLETLGIFANVFAGAHLLYLDVSDNAIGEQGLNPIKPVLQLPSLRVLKLQNNGFAAESLQKLGDILDDAVCASLEEVYFYNNMAGVGGARSVGEKLLPRMKNLRVFRYEGMRPSTEGCGALAKGLLGISREGKLRKLLLEGSFGSDASAFRDLLATLMNSPELAEIRLYDAELGDGRADQVSDALKRQQLVAFELPQNEITIKSVSRNSVVQLVKRNVATLIRLDLSANELYSSGAGALMSVFQPEANSPLEVLKLDENFLGHNCVASLTGAALPQLKLLSLDENAFTESDIELLQGAFGETLVEMENNDEDMGCDDDDEGLEEDEEDEKDVDELTEQMQKLSA